MDENELLLVWGEEEPWIYRGSYSSSAQDYRAYLKKNVKNIHRAVIAIHPCAMHLVCVDSSPVLTFRERQKHRRHRLSLELKNLEPGHYCFSWQVCELSSGIYRNWVLVCVANELQRIWARLYDHLNIYPEIVIPMMSLQSLLPIQKKMIGTTYGVFWCESKTVVLMVYESNQLIKYDRFSTSLQEDNVCKIDQALLRVIENESPEFWCTVGHRCAFIENLLSKKIGSLVIEHIEDEGGYRHSSSFLKAAMMRN